MKIGERANVDVIESGVVTEISIAADVLHAPACSKFAAAALGLIRTNDKFKADVAISLRVLVGDRACAQDSDPHGDLWSVNPTEVDLITSGRDPVRATKGRKEVI